MSLPNQIVVSMRYIHREGGLVLQQQMWDTFTGNYDWKDVVVEEENPDGKTYKQL